jgi:hypothetical protein
MPSVFLIRPLTAQCDDWLTENVSDDAMYLGRSLAVEHRYVEDLVMGLRENGFMPGKDFEVSC